MTQEACELECTGDSNCVAYSYAASSENGQCIIYGPGQDGSCTSHPEIGLLDQCGTCSISEKKEKGTCGSCEIPRDTVSFEGFVSYAQNAGLCELQGGTWTEGVWTAGTWEDPLDGWTGDSHFTTHVNYVTSVGGYDCYDKDRSDHMPKCTGTTTDSGSCQERFEAETDGMEFENLTEADCISGGSGCVFTPAPVAPASTFFVHSPITLTAGWNAHSVPFGDALNDAVPIALGACRAEGTQIAPPTQKDCRWDLCVSSTGESVTTQAGCRQACLDDPSGTCVSYAHADNGYCVIYGPLVHEHAEHSFVIDGDERVDTWDTRDRDLKFCFGNIPNNPPGCKDGNTAKPNAKYMCQTLKMTPERWEAYGAKGDPIDLHVTMDLAGVTVEDMKKDEISLSLRKKVADLAFWDVDRTEMLSVEKTTEGVSAIVVVMTDSTAAPHQELLIKRQSEMALANSTYFDVVIADALPEGAAFVGVTISSQEPKKKEDPADSDMYHHLVDENGDSGPCRGVTASDKVDSRDKGSMTQEACELECTGDSNCVAYSYAASSENGQCIIYGPGQDGSCTSHPEIGLLDQCGTCSISEKKEKGTCGSCEIPRDTVSFEGFVSYAQNAGLCELQGGTWTEGVWTAGTWEDPLDGWTGDSHFTTHVNYVTSVGGYDCYDKDRSDHMPKCTGTTTDSGSCQERFEAETDGMEFENLTEADCISGGSGCVFTPAPVAPASTFFVHSPITLTAGWNAHSVPFGDALNDAVPIALGACRAEGTQIAPPTQKDCRWDLCVSSTGESVTTQAGCRQACLDDPSGTCVSYAHADNGYCVIYGPLVHEHAEHSFVIDGDERVDTWDTRDRDLKFCFGNIPNNPPGCKDGNTAKPNAKYMCQTLKMTPERWEAYGAKGDPIDLHVTMDLAGVTVEDMKKDEISLSLRKKVADLAFWDVDRTEMLSVEKTTEGVSAIVVVMTDSTAAPHQELLIKRQSEMALANSTYFDVVIADALPEGAAFVGVTISSQEPKKKEDPVDTPKDPVDTPKDVADTPKDPADTSGTMMKTFNIGLFAAFVGSVVMV